MSTIEDRLNKLSNVQTHQRHESFESFRARIARTRLRPRDDRAGRFKVGQRVYWRALENGSIHHGTVVEVVKRGMYPGLQHKNITLCGYYRETESYVIASGDRQYWPRVGNLRPEGENP